MHDPREGCAEMGGGTCEFPPLGPWVEFPAGHDPCERCAELGGGTHASSSIGATGGDLWYAMRVRGVPNWAGKKGGRRYTKQRISEGGGGGRGRRKERATLRRGNEDPTTQEG